MKTNVNIQPKFLSHTSIEDFHTYITHQLDFFQKNKNRDYQSYSHREKDITINFYSLESDQTVYAVSENGINIYEDQWKTKREVIISRINAQLGISKRIYGRLIEVKSITIIEANEFISKNHLNAVTKSKYKIGAYYKDELIGCMTFSGARNIPRNGEIYRSYELIRYCSQLNTTIVGGMSKMIHYFIKKYSPDDIITYVDKDWSMGLGYQKMGFEIIGSLPPINFAINKSTKERIQSKKLILSSEKSSEQNSFIEVYNSGSLKFLYDNKQ